MVNQRFSALVLLTTAAMTVTAVVLTSGILSGARTVNNYGNLNGIGVGVYWDSSCTNNVSTIDWGYLDPGAAKDVTIYIKNEGTVPMTLAMTTDEWNPTSAASYLTVSWNREGSQVNPGSVLATVLTLSVSSSISDIQSFSFDITITGTE
jgi:hypothetical protein